MKNKKAVLTDLQLIAIIIVAVIDANLFAVPRLAAQHAGRDGWLSILLTGIIVLITATLIYKLCSRFPNRILPEFSMIIFGKPLGFAVGLLYVGYALILAGISLRLFTEVAKTWTLFWTPQSVFVLLLLLPGVYLVSKGPAALGRVSEIFFFALLLTLLFLFVPIRQADLLHLRPIGQHGLWAIGGAVPELLANYRGFDILLILFPLVAQRKRVYRLYIIAIVLVIFFSTLTTLFTFTVLGVEQTQILSWPILQYMASDRLPVIERVDNLFLILWTLQIIGLVALHYYAAVISISSMTKRKYYLLWTILLWPGVFAFAILPPNQLRVFHLTTLIGYWGEIFIFTLVILLLAVAAVRGLTEKERGS